MMVYWMFKGSWSILECCVALSSMSSNMSLREKGGYVGWLLLVVFGIPEFPNRCLFYICIYGLTILL